jgi:hypothetical protein
MAPPTQEKTEGLAALWLPDQGDRAAIPPLCSTEEGSPMEEWNALEAFCFPKVKPIAPESCASFDGLHLALAAEEPHKGLSLFVGLGIEQWQPSCPLYNLFNNKLVQTAQNAGIVQDMHGSVEDLREQGSSELQCEAALDRIHARQKLPNALINKRLSDLGESSGCGRLS